MLCSLQKQAAVSPIRIPAKSPVHQIANISIAGKTPHHIFLVPEILESIFLQLPLQDLLVKAQRVSREWMTAIDSSIALQQALFFYPSEIDSPLHVNPLLRKAFPPWFRTTNNICKGQTVAASFPWASTPEARDAILRKDASWRRMLPCQPPKNILEVTGKKNIKEGIFELKGTVGVQDGVRMGSLYDFGFDSVRKHVSTFWIQWNEATTEGGEREIQGNEATSQGDERDERDEEKLKIFTEHSWFKCGPRHPPDIGDEFRSEGYEQLVMSWREERRSMQWHGGFGRPPYGGWQIEKAL